MPRAKKVVTTAEQVIKLTDNIDKAAVVARGTIAVPALAAPYGAGLVEDYTGDFYALAAIAATQLTVTPHDSNDIIDLRIDRALFIAGKLIAKAKEVQ